MALNTETSTRHKLPSIPTLISAQEDQTDTLDLSQNPMVDMVPILDST